MCKKLNLVSHFSIFDHESGHAAYFFTCATGAKFKPQRHEMPTSYLTPQKLHQILVQLVVEFVGVLCGLGTVFDGLEFLRAFPADVYAEDFLALRKFRDDFFEGFEGE